MKRLKALVVIPILWLILTAVILAEGFIRLVERVFCERKIGRVVQKRRKEAA